MDTQSTYIGIDLGIGSCGWAVSTDTSLIALGTRMFDVPETDKERTPTNQLRRTYRGMRRVINRRRQRMNDVRALLQDHGLLPTADKHALRAAHLDPWEMRVAGLDRVLSPLELAVALGHMAKHRGFKSNSKRDRGSNAASETGKVLGWTEKNKERCAQWRTVGEAFAKDPGFQARKRNRDGDYSRSILRSELEHEVRTLLAAQRRLGNPQASQELADSFIDRAFSQRPLADSEDKVGPCPFLPDEKRAAKAAPSFERFRLLSRLNVLRVAGQPLTPDQVQRAMVDFGQQQGLSYARLRKLAHIPDGQRFEGIKPEEESKWDVTSRSGKAMKGSNALYKILGEAGWNSLHKQPTLLDRIAAILTFREDITRIQMGLQELGLDPLILHALMQGVQDGAFHDFKGAGHISAAACRTLNPWLADGLMYSDACDKAGFKHSEQAEIKLEDIPNPIARKAIGEAFKQVKAIIRAHGMPDFIHVELARDLGKSLEERQDMENGLKKREAEKDRLRAAFCADSGQQRCNGEDLLRYELWKQQNGRCLYTDQDISITDVASGNNLVQVDHILPRSRFGDDSFANKTLCYASANQAKKDRTPYEWFSDSGQDWTAFVQRVEQCKTIKAHKKRLYQLKDATEREEGFRSRNLNDTRYACRQFMALIKQEYPELKDRIVARPGPLTSHLRRAWGVESLKKDPETGQRLPDDRHHALDAVIVALTSQSMVQRLTKLFQIVEQRGLTTQKWSSIGQLAHLFRETGGMPREFQALEQPWPTFRHDVQVALSTIIVSRAERRRARGASHKETITQVKLRDDKPVLFERKAVEKLTLADLDRLKDAERNHRMIDVLRQWIEIGKPKDQVPTGPQGHPVRKVRLESNDKLAVPVREGSAARGEMCRVDVFRKANKKGKMEFYLVPIYPHQVADLQNWPQPPNRAVQAHKDESEWPEMTAEYEFLWSLYPMSWVEAVKADGTIIEGYYRSYDRAGAAISITPHHSNQAKPERPGAKTLTSFRKFAVDRFGNRSEIIQEIRTWHGEACISASNPD